MALEPRLAVGPLGGDLAVAQGQEIDDMGLEARAADRRARLDLLDDREGGRHVVADERERDVGDAFEDRRREPRRIP